MKAGFWYNIKVIATGICLALAMHCTAQHLNDELFFGNPASERKHALTAIKSEVIKGGLNQTARRLLPLDTSLWYGGSLSFIMKVDPVQQNYFTVKLWGSDKDKTMILLFSEDKQVGYRHLGDIDLLWLGNGEPPFNERFFYITLPVPIQHTKGKTKVNLELRSYGDIWGYGETFEKYQRKMSGPTIGFYKAYTHTQTMIVPGKEEVQGKPLTNIAVRATPGDEIMLQLKKRVNDELNKILSSSKPPHQQEIMFLASAYSVRWTPAYKNKQVITKIIGGIDAHYRKYVLDTTIIYSDPNIYNSEWLTCGPVARSIRSLWSELQPELDKAFDDGKGNTITRSHAYTTLMKESVTYGATHRRHYTNQSMIIDLFMYDCNRALMLLDPSSALPEYQTLRYLYESLGLAPWLGKETPNGPEKNLGENYWQLTAKGLTKELGFVGYYGEVLDWVVDIYRSTSYPGMPGTGDEKIKQQLLKMMKARTYFRYPSVDSDGYKAMLAEAVVGWRDAGHYPGNALYGDRGIAWDATPLMMAAATLDPAAVGIAQQMIADNQLFKMIEDKLKLGGIRVTKSLLHIPDEYELIKKQPQQSKRLPMSAGMPGFVFADEEDGVLAIKNGEDILYASLYWRARNAVNGLAKVHYITPAIDRIANIYIQSEFDSSGMYYTRPDWVNLGFSAAREWYGGIHSAHAGEILPIAKIPAGISFEPGDENVFAGKASFYKMEYGNYLIAMNCSKVKSFQLDIPARFDGAKILTTNNKYTETGKIMLSPQTTIVLYKNFN
ncbi:MAG TPA: hypothetical protein VJU78_11915 [Chitinophagaceae bacterium]|nr:hypothetical protein [Chitinophagaceae bacterium]